MPTNVTLQQLLGTLTVTKAISRIKTPMQRLQSFFGMLPGGPSVNPVGGRQAAWDIFDKTRSIATGRPPVSGPTNVPVQKIGQQSAPMFRASEKILLEEERIFRTRPIGGNFGEVDSRGQRYVAQQEAYLAQRFMNLREFMVSRMLRGEFYIKINNGDELTVTDSSASPNIKVDFLVPAGNKSQLNINGGGNTISATWSNIATPIVDNILALNAAYEQAHGFPLRHVWCDSIIWGYVMNNTQVRNLGGSANQVFSQFAPTGLTNSEGIQDTGFTGVLRAIPWLTWHVYDAGLDVDGTFTKFFPSTAAAFLPDPDSRIFEWYEGSEIVAENVMDAGQERYGMSAWTTRVIDPAGFELKAVDNGLPVVYIPKAIGWGTVSF